MRIENLIFSLIINSWSGEIIHVSHDPDVIANKLNVIIGIKEFIDWWLDWNARDLMLDLFEIKDIRIEYAAVIPIEDSITIDNIRFKFDEIIFSIIMSFEKNPDMKGIPIRAILLIPKIDKERGWLMKLIPIIRISW